MNRFLIILFVLIELSGCERKPMQELPDNRYNKIMGNIITNRNIDAYQNKGANELYRELKSRTSPIIADIEALAIQESEVILPKPEMLSEEEYISINTSETTPLKDILVEISRKAKLNTNIDSKISDSIILNVQDKTITEIMDIIEKHSNIVYSIDNGVLYVHVDTPVVKNYTVDFINVIRSTRSEVNIDTKVVSGDASGLSSGSSSRITADFRGDLWESLESGLRAIMDKNGYDDNELYSINKQAGIITVSAKNKTHKDIESYLIKVRAISSAQVLIEAKIVEITLNNTFRAGIDWTFFMDNSNPYDNVHSSYHSAFSDTSSLDKTAINMSIDLGIGSLTAAVNLLEEFGVTRTVASPRILAVNNQQAVLTFAKNHVYFVVDIDENTSSSSANNRVSIKSNLKSVPIGVILSLQPSINTEKNEVTMSVRPTLSRISGGVRDPGTEYTSQSQGLRGLTSEVPIIEVRELDSMLKISSGQIMAIGGLIENKEINEDHGLPILSRVPLIGNLFKSTKRSNIVTETVVFIKATIVSSDGKHSLSEEDRNLYNKYSIT